MPANVKVERGLCRFSNKKKKRKCDVFFLLNSYIK